MPWLRWLELLSVVSLLAALPVPSFADQPFVNGAEARPAGDALAQAPRTIDALSSRLQEWIDERLANARQGSPDMVEVPLTIGAYPDTSGGAQYTLGPGYGSVQLRIEPLVGEGVELAAPMGRNQVFSVQGWFTGRDYTVEDPATPGTSITLYEMQLVSARRSRGEVDEFFRVLQEPVPAVTPPTEATISVPAEPEPEPVPVPEPVVEPEPVPEPIVEPTPEPVPEPIVEPTPEPVPEPIVEPTPVVEPPVEPVVEPTPPVEPAVEPEPQVVMAAQSLAVQGNPTINGSTARVELSIGGAGDTLNLAYTIEGPHGSRMGQVEAQRAGNGTYVIELPLADPVNACDGTWLYLIDTTSGASTEAPLDLSWESGC